MYEQEYELAKTIAKKVGNFAARQQKKAIKKELKADHSFVTETDIVVEKRIIRAIKKYFPHDNILAEETESADTIQRNRLWIIDPIDGTHGFAAKEDDYCIIIGFMDQGEMKCGVIYQPNAKRMIYAEKGKGAFCNGNKTIPTSEQDLKKILVGTALWYFAKNNKLDEGLLIIRRVVENCLDIRRYGAAGLDLYRVASGKEDAYYEYGLKPWDAVASILVTEAGGIVSNCDGTPLNLFKRENDKWCVNLLASANEAIHEKMIQLLNHKV